MAQLPAGWRISGRWLLVVAACFFLAACDIKPFSESADLPVPVETVTAVEVDVNDLIVDTPSSPDRSAQYPP